MAGFGISEVVDRLAPLKMQTSVMFVFTHYVQRVGITVDVYTVIRLPFPFFMPYLVSHVPNDPDHDFRNGARVRHAAGPVNIYVEAVTLQERLSADLVTHAGEGVFAQDGHQTVL